MNAFKGILGDTLELSAKENDIKMQQKKILIILLLIRKKLYLMEFKKGEISPDTDIEEAVKK